MASSNKTKSTKPGAAKAVVKKPLAAKLRPDAKSKPAAAARSVKTENGPVAPCRDEALLALKSEVATLRALLTRPADAVPASPDGEVDALRRTVNDLLERRLESVVRDLVGLRNTAAGLAGAEAVLTAADALLTRLGAIRYDAQRLDHVDPLIHAVSREAREADLPEGVIAASLRPGFRTARGVVLAKALVAVNRRT